MRTVLVNALSVTNQSGFHVLVGVLDQLIVGLRDVCCFVVVCRPDRADLKARFEGRVTWCQAPVSTVRWLPRAVWEHRNLKPLAIAHGADVYLTTSGIAASSLAIPQVVLCPNPWALVPAARRRRDALKAGLQRCAYRHAMQTAEVMVFISDFLRSAYRKNAGRVERRGLVVHLAADAETHQRAQQWIDRPRKPGQILCVSAMAPHKNSEAVIRAVHALAPSLEATLVLAGSWPDAAYEKKIRALVTALRMDDRVRFAGFVSREALDRLYAESQVFCLMSRCESFGIPAIEAQLFGTPVVCSNVCAVPEICGDGGRFLDPDDVHGIAAALGQLLDDREAWMRVSEAARRNAERFSWERCAQPLVDLFRDWLSPKPGEARALPLSVVILCRNEAVNLRRCLQALRGVAEIVVLDDGSTDGSRALAQSLGARVVEHRFVSFADQRNWAMDHAGLAHDWVLHLDADEGMTPEALNELAGLLPSLSADQVGWLARKILLRDRWLRHSADYPVYVARLVHRRGPRFMMQGHGEKIDAPSESAVYLREPMLHHAWSKGWEDWRERHWRYAQAEAERLHQAGVSMAFKDCFDRDRAKRRQALRSLSFSFPFRPVCRFLYASLLRGGVRDGRAGLRFCLAMAQYEWMISVCLRRLKTGNGDRPDSRRPTGKDRSL